MGVYLDKASKYDQALKELLKIDNITGMDFTTGKSSLFCKIEQLTPMMLVKSLVKFTK
jgi:hypothetical protein